MSCVPSQLILKCSLFFIFFKSFLIAGYFYFYFCYVCCTAISIVLSAGDDFFLFLNKSSSFPAVFIIVSYLPFFFIFFFFFFPSPSAPSAELRTGYQWWWGLPGGKQVCLCSPLLFSAFLSHYTYPRMIRYHKKKKKAGKDKTEDTFNGTIRLSCSHKVKMWVATWGGMIFVLWKC